MKIIIKNVNVLDGTCNMNVQANQNVLIENNLITRITDEFIKDKCKVIDGTGKYLTPGLINLHVHMPSNGKLSKKTTNKRGLIKFIKNNPIGNKLGLAIVKKNAKLALLSGTTTERAVGGVGTLDSQVRDLINKGKAHGARLIVANEAICTNGGHMEGTVASPVSNIDEAVKAVEERFKQGVDFIKIMITGGVLDCKELGHPGDLKMDSSFVKAICDKAHSLGLKVAAHIEGPEGMNIAIDSGVDTIEHGFITDSKHIDEFIKRGGVLVQTIAPTLPFVYLDPKDTGFGEEAKINTNAFMSGSIELVKYMLSHDGIVGFGTDVGCPLITHYDAWREMEYYYKMIPNSNLNDALHIMTEVNAKILGLGNKLGLVKEGYIADLVLLNENPLINIRAFSSPSLVIQDGHIFKSKFKKNKFVKSQLDNMKLN